MYISLISYLKQRHNQTGIRDYSVNSFSRIRSVERPLISRPLLTDEQLRHVDIYIFSN